MFVLFHLLFKLIVFKSINDVLKKAIVQKVPVEIQVAKDLVNTRGLVEHSYVVSEVANGDFFIFHGSRNLCKQHTKL